MAQNSGIGWTHDTANLWWGCVEVAPECDLCYAREWAKRFDRAKWGAKEPRLAIKGVWGDLARYQRIAAEAKSFRRVFVGSMMDIAEIPQPLIDGAGKPIEGMNTEKLRNRFFNEVVPASPNLLFLLLSKRPQNFPKVVPPSWLDKPPSNVMYGTSIGTVKTQSTALDAIKRIPGRRFLSMEPLLEPVDMDGRLDGIEWVITGCESNQKNVGRFADGYEAAARSIMLACKSAGVMYFNKQMPINGLVSHNTDQWPADLRGQEVPGVR